MREGPLDPWPLDNDSQLALSRGEDDSLPYHTGGLCARQGKQESEARSREEPVTGPQRGQQSKLAHDPALGMRGHDFCPNTQKQGAFP